MRDVVVSATGASDFVLSRESVAAALRSRKGRPLLLVDLAVPRDLDPAINELDGCFLYDIDDLEAVVTETLSGRRGEATRAEQLVAWEADRFREWQASLDVVPAIASLRALAEEIRDRELAKAEGRLGRLPESERKLVESVTSQIVAKLLHLPTVRMKEAAAAADGVVYADVVRHLFGLGRGGAAAMTARFTASRPLPLQVPTAFVRIRPSTQLNGARGCGESRPASRRSCAASRRFPRQ